MPSCCKSLKFFRTSIASLDPETVELPAFSILSAMFTGACGPPEKLSLAFCTVLEYSAHDCETRLYSGRNLSFILQHSLTPLPHVPVLTIHTKEISNSRDVPVDKLYILHARFVKNIWSWILAMYKDLGQNIPPYRPPV